MNVSIYNHQLCVLPRSLWKFARKSISDWKNIYLPVCEGCAAAERCGGLFASAEHLHSDHLRAFRSDEIKAADLRWDILSLNEQEAAFYPLSVPEIPTGLRKETGDESRKRRSI